MGLSSGDLKEREDYSLNYHPSLLHCDCQPALISGDARLTPDHVCSSGEIDAALNSHTFRRFANPRAAINSRHFSTTWAPPIWIALLNPPHRGEW